MKRHPPGVHELAGRLLRQEAGGATGPPAAAAALKSAWGKLARELEPLVGRGGADALFSRAIHLARREFPSLYVPPPSRDAPFDFAGLWASMREREEGEEAGVAVLAHLLGLLVGLLGEELGLLPVRAAWPDV